jgi:hypothetical protein
MRCAVVLLIAAVTLDISRGPLRGMPSQARNEDQMEHVRELREEAEHEHLAREVEDAAEARAPRGIRASLRRIFRR